MCADFAFYDAPVTLVLETDATHGTDVEAMEYAIDEREMATYDGPVEIAEPGSYTVVVQGIDAGGEATDPGGQFRRRRPRLSGGPARTFARAGGPRRRGRPAA